MTELARDVDDAAALMQRVDRRLPEVSLGLLVKCALDPDQPAREELER